MDRKLFGTYLVELVGTFALVYFAAGVVVVNYLATNPANPPQDLSTVPVNMHQPGALGVAVAQGLIFAAMLALTVPVSGGYLNPAILIMLWVFNRVDTKRMAGLLGMQLLGALLAALCLRFNFSDELLQLARFGATHVNFPAYARDNVPDHRGGLFGATAIEFILTFVLVLAIFGLPPSPLSALDRGNGEGHYLRVGLAGGAVLAAGVLFALPLTGAAANPARWFGPVFWEWTAQGAEKAGASPVNPWSDAFVYLAGPIIGALIAGLFCSRILLPAAEEASATPPGKLRK